MAESALEMARRDLWDQIVGYAKWDKTFRAPEVDKAIARLEAAAAKAAVDNLINSAVDPCGHPLAFFERASNICRLCKETAAAQLAGRLEQAEAMTALVAVLADVHRGDTDRIYHSCSEERDRLRAEAERT